MCTFQILGSLFCVCWLPWLSQAFVLGDQQSSCLAASCNCSDKELLDCNDQGFTSIPNFNYSSQDHFHILTLSFSSNNLTTIPDNAFQSISALRVNHIRLVLTNNQISSISHQAFHGIENRLNEIRLESNLLTVIPDSITQLHHLTSLHIHDNPIFSFDGLLSLGRSLTELTIGHKNLTKWPSALNQLRHLHSLEINGLKISAIPSDALQHSSLSYLRLSGTDLYDFPTTICHLKHLQTLDFSLNKYHAPEAGFFKPCHNDHLSSVKTLILDDDEFYQVPTDIFGTFPHLQNLTILGSKLLTNLHGLVVPAHNQLQTLDLTGNSIATIPEVVSHLPKLTKLDVSNNPIICSCFMSWMKTWQRRDNVTIVGVCKGGEQIRHYIDNSLLKFC